MEALGNSYRVGFKEDYLNLFGIFEGKAKEPERYEQTLARFRQYVPLPPNITCRQIEKNISGIDDLVFNLREQLAAGASGASKDAINRDIRAWNQIILDHKARYAKMDCALNQESRETNEWISKTEAALGRQENNILGATNVNKYLIYGLAGVVVLGGLYFILK